MIIEIYYKDKKTSSARIRNGKGILYISSRLSPEERQRHVEVLTKKLHERALRANRAFPIPGAGPKPFTLPMSDILTDGDLTAMAARINREWYRHDYRSVRFKPQSARWGSCSLKTRNIYVSERLKGAPSELIEYLLVHELCHLAVPNHGPSFWRLVSRACPDYKEKRRMLRLWGLRFQD